MKKYDIVAIGEDLIDLIPSGEKRSGNLMDNNIIIADMHTHSEHSHDSICPIAEMAEVQRERGTKIFAVTDHCDIEYWDNQDIPKIIGDSVEDARKQNEALDGIEILKGIEICECFWNQAATDKMLALKDYDVIIGSVHAVKFDGNEIPYSKTDFGLMKKKTAEEYLKAYFGDMLTMLKTTEFDILAHLTCPLRYMNGKYKLGIDCKEYKAQITEILEFIIKHNIALEINTSCVGSNYNEFMPEEWIVSLYKDLGGRLITLGSDAHISENASKAFPEALKMLKQNGFDSIYYYKNRKPIKINI